ncbi:hypothetical protein Q4589_00195 [Cobetia marina]|nr:MULTISPECIES: hypothetical protein [Cobetia]MDA5562783.1 hypothetical protein [Cobetia sp. MMG027]MDH2293179.1 hypothetical protein [Cobetia sp. 1AS1]MDO6785999.1 hypothetical protein [Cobetia marina]MDO6816369.1 hypothetical protein [Cobetia amphilecti]
MMISQRRDHWRRKYTLVMQVPGVQDAMANHAAAQEEQALGYSSGRYQGD